jgi:hypothetical protein
MVLKTLLATLDSSHTKLTAVDIRIGNYSPDKKDSAWTASLLLIRTLSRFTTLLALFRRKLDRCRISGDSRAQEWEYLEQVLVSLERSTSVIGSELRNSLRRLD